VNEKDFRIALMRESEGNRQKGGRAGSPADGNLVKKRISLGYVVDLLRSAMPLR